MPVPVLSRLTFLPTLANLFTALSFGPNYAQCGKHCWPYNVPLPTSLSHKRIKLLRFQVRLRLQSVGSLRLSLALRCLRSIVRRLAPTYLRPMVSWAGRTLWIASVVVWVLLTVASVTKGNID